MNLTVLKLRTSMSKVDTMGNLGYTAYFTDTQPALHVFAIQTYIVGKEKEVHMHCILLEFQSRRCFAPHGKRNLPEDTFGADGKE